MSMDSDNVCTKVPQLIEQLKPLFRGGDFDEVHKILLSHENYLKFELEKHSKELDSMKEKCRLAELKSREAEHEKSMFLRDLQKISGRERRHLELQIRVLRDRLKRADEQRQVIFKLNEELAELEGQMVENNRASNMKVAKMTREIERLKGEKLAAYSALVEMKQKLCETDQTVEQLRNLNSSAYGSIKELRGCLLRSYGSDEEMRRNVSIQRMLKSDEIIKEMRLDQAGIDKAIYENRGDILRPDVIVSNRSMKPSSTGHSHLESSTRPFTSRPVSPSAQASPEQGVDLTEIIRQLYELLIQWLESTPHFESSSLPGSLQCPGSSHAEGIADAMPASAIIKELREKLSSADRTIQDLRAQNLKSDENIKEMMLRLEKADKDMEDLRRQNLEASETIEKLNQNLLTSDDSIKETRLRQADKNMEDLKRRELVPLQAVGKSKSQTLKGGSRAELIRKRFKMLKPSTTTTDDLTNPAEFQENTSALVPEKDFLCSGDGKPSRKNVSIIGVATSDVDLLKRDRGNLPSPSLTKDEVANGKGIEGFQAGSQSGCPAQSVDGVDLEGRKKRNILLVSDSSEDGLFSDDDSCSSSQIDELLSSIKRPAGSGIWR